MLLLVEGARLGDTHSDKGLATNAASTGRHYYTSDSGRTRNGCGAYASITGRAGAARGSERYILPRLVDESRESSYELMKADTVLYFGCRSLSSDHYYASEWDRYRQEGARIRVAASRDGPDKVYVQDLIREDGEMLNDCITRKGAYVYICG